MYLIDQLITIQQKYKQPIKKYTIKSGRKTRDVYDPVPELKTILKEMNKSLTQLYTEELEKHNLTTNAHAYLPNKSIKTNANEHKNSTTIIKFDFSKFYDSVQLDYIMPYLEQLNNKPLSKKQIDAVNYCIINDETNGVTQGLPVSGALAGLASIPFWKTLKSNLPENIHFTQYSDDLTFSLKNNQASEDFNQERLQYIVEESLKQSNRRFNLNHEKTTVQHKQYRRVTGVSINADNQMTTKRENYRQLRAFVHLLSKNNELEKTLKIFGFKSKQAFTGKVSYMRQIDESGKIDRYLQKNAQLLLKHKLFETWLIATPFA